MRLIMINNDDDGGCNQLMTINNDDCDDQNDE